MDEEEEIKNALIGQNPMMEEQSVFNAQDQILGGLGLGGASYAAQTGRLPTTPPSPQVLNILTGRDAPRSLFAQRVAANDAARLAARFQPPALIGSTQVGTTGVFQPPAVTYTGGPPATTTSPLTTTSTGTPPRGQPRLTGPTRLSADDFDYRIGGNKPTSSILNSVKNVTSGLVKGGVVTGLLTPNEMGRAEVFPTGMNATLFEDADGNISLVPKEGYLPMTGDMPSRAVMKADQEFEKPAFTNTIEEIVTKKQDFGPGYEYPQEDLSQVDKFETDVREDTAQRQDNIVSGQVELAKGIRELDTVSDDQRAAQDFLNEQAERLEIPATDVITPFQEQARLTADLFTDPNTAIGQFVPRATFTLPDGTIIQEDEGGNRREISAEQLEQFERDMFELGQDGVLGLGEGGDRGVLKDIVTNTPMRPRPMGPEETIERLGGRTLNEYLNAPQVRTPGISGLKTDPQGRMIPNRPQTVAPETEGQPTAQAGPAKVPDEIMSQVVRTGVQTMEFRDANGDGIEDRQQGIFRPGELLGYDAQGNEVRAPGTQQPVNRIPASAQPASALSDFEQESLAREARLAERDRLPGETQTQRDTRLAQSRTQGSSQGGLSQSDARDLAQGMAKDATEGEKMRALQIQSRLGLGQFKPEQTELQKDFTQKRIALMDAQLAQSGIVPSAPPVVDPETGVITQEYSDGTTRFKGVGRSPSGGGFDLDGFLPDGEGGQSSDTVRMTDRDGKPRDVSKGDVQEAIKNGYTLVGEDFTPNI